MSVLPKLIYKFYVIPIKIPARLFVDIEKIILKYIYKGIKIAKTILKKKDNMERISLSDLKTFNIATIIKRI